MHISAKIIAVLALAVVILGKAEAMAPSHDACGLTTGRVMDRSEVLEKVPYAILGDSSYAEVDSKALAKFYAHFREELFREGVVRWDERFTCKHFAAYFAEMAQAEFSSEMFHSRSKAHALAVGSVWYLRGNGDSPHAIIEAITERGRVYLEPQTGAFITLSPKEEASIYFKFF